MGEFQSVRELMELWADKLPEKRFGADGAELLSSRIRQAVYARQLQLEHEAKDPELKRRNALEKAQRDAEERKARNAEMESRFFAEMPDALARMGLEPQEANALAALETRPAVEASQAWLKGRALFLCLGGRPGSGKSVAAASLLPEVAVDRINCESVQGRQWNSSLARYEKAQEIARMSLYGEETQKRLERLKRVRLLVIDDLGAEAKADAWWSLFDELVDARARHEVRTAITSNLSSSELKARYGDRVFRRLKDFGQFVACTWPLQAVKGAP